MKFKSFHIKHLPTGTAKSLSDVVDSEINGWAAKEKPQNAKVSVSAETKSSYPEVFVIVTYD